MAAAKRKEPDSITMEYYLAADQLCRAMDTHEQTLLDLKKDTTTYLSHYVDDLGFVLDRARGPKAQAWNDKYEALQSNLRALEDAVIDNAFNTLYTPLNKVSAALGSVHGKRDLDISHRMLVLAAFPDKTGENVAKMRQLTETYQHASAPVYQRLNEVREHFLRESADMPLSFATYSLRGNIWHMEERAAVDVAEPAERIAFLKKSFPALRKRLPESRL